MQREIITLDGQVKLLKECGLKINDEEGVKEFLLLHNYYSVENYSLTLQDHGKYYPGVTFQNIVDIYNFDAEFRICLFRIIEDIETCVKSVISYYFTQEYGAYGYSDANNFKLQGEDQIYRDLLEKVDATLKTKKKHEIYLKDIEDKRGRVPFWAYIESFTFSDISKFYTLLKPQVAEPVAETFGLKYSSKCKIMSNYLRCLFPIRNVCAHGGRIYNQKFYVKPNLSKIEQSWLRINKNGVPDNSSIFGIIIIIHRIATEESWNNFKDCVIKLCKKYPFVDMAHYGFPENWEEQLS